MGEGDFDAQLLLDTPATAAPGQAAVVYVDERVIAGATIALAQPSQTAARETAAALYA